MWNMVITLTSCGYGDIYPKSYFGRVVGVLICFWGVIIISYVVVAVTDVLEYSYEEEKCYFGSCDGTDGSHCQGTNSVCITGCCSCLDPLFLSNVMGKTKLSHFLRKH